MTTTLIPLTGGGLTLVDSDVAAMLGARRVWMRPNGYALIWHNSGHRLLHRFIMDAASGLEVDHINGEKLDNRRANLRLVSHSVNLLNRHKTSGASRFLGVRIDAERSCWKSSVKISRKRHFVGRYRSEVVAALMYDRAKVSLVDVPISTNFPRTIKAKMLRAFLIATAGKVFRVVFSRRKDGRQREMLCRTGVAKGVTGKGMTFEPAEKNLFVVYDMTNRAYRCIPLERVLTLRIAKVNYRIEGNHEKQNAQVRRVA